MIWEIVKTVLSMMLGAVVGVFCHSLVVMGRDE
jgi:hypothetical protein